MYHAMQALGHNCYIVASTSDQSGTGGRLIFASNAKLTSDSEFGEYPIVCAMYKTGTLKD